MTTFEEKIRTAITTSDAQLAGRLADHLRFGCGMTYPEILTKVQSVIPIDAADWDALMYASEDEK